MDTINSLVKATLVGVALTLLMTSCPGPCPEAVHQFAITAEFTPQKDSIRLGDTLYLSSSFPTKLKDVSSGQEVDYANATNIGSNVSIDQLPLNKPFVRSPAENLIYAVDSFRVFALRGRIYTDATVPRPERVKQLTYQQVRSTYELRVGFIPKTKGIYCLTIGNGFSGSRPNQGCDKASFNISLTNTNQHLNYLASFLNETTVAPFSVRGGYCFKVY